MFPHHEVLLYHRQQGHVPKDWTPRQCEPEPICPPYKLFYPVPDIWLTPWATHVMAVNSTRECIRLRTASRYRHQWKEKSQRKLRQEDCLEPKVSLGYVVSSRPGCIKD